MNDRHLKNNSRKRKVLGIDEAGRGPVFGPMIMCGALIYENKLEQLSKIGVKDSKSLAPRKRVSLSSHIVEILDDHILLEISPKEIDDSVEKNELNLLEARKMAELIEKLRPDIAYVDSPQKSTERYTKKIREGLSFEPKIIAENYAEIKYPIVAAASILAKVKRDRIIERLRQKYGDFGSGYPADGRTKEFLVQWYKRHKSFPEEVRRSWKTIKNIVRGKDSKQKTLF
ncbi:MAG: ribonuclease HII [Candidatus Hodarchaeota archaeon]